ncbi:MAG: sulfotransferase [Ferrovum sp.]|nr:sulfotransferase [Ferrovum sp.]
MFPQFVGVTGLPQSGSTLLGQLLSLHPDIQCEGQSSPLCNLLLGLRRMVSDDQFFLSQLDYSFEQSYGHLSGAMEGFLRGWYGPSDKSVVVDKNRAWLHCVELLLKLAPEARIIVTLRELGQVYGSIEAQHQKTILLDFIDHLADYDRFGRADALFAKDKVIGAPMISLHAVQDLPDEVKSRLFFMRFEDLMVNPVLVMKKIYQWLGLEPIAIDLTRLPIKNEVESDSHYRMKYLHHYRGVLKVPQRHAVPPRIQAQIESACAWFYQAYYPKN